MAVAPVWKDEQGRYHFRAAPYQKEFLEKRRNDELVIMVTGVATGKTIALSRWFGENFLLGRSMIAGAQSFGALKKVLFKEIIRFFKLLDLEPILDKSEMSITMKGVDAIIYGVTNENYENNLGLSDMWGFGLDEAAYAKEDFYRFMCDRCRGEGIDGYTRLISSPNADAVEPWFADLCEQHEECLIRASSLDNPFTTDRYKKKLAERYGGEGTPMYRQQVLGDILRKSFKTAILRDTDFQDIPLVGQTRGVYVGMDFAGTGNDSTCIVVRNDYRILERIYLYDGDGNQEINALLDVLHRYDVAGVAFDATGGFSKSMDVIKHKIRNLTEVNFGSNAEDPIFANIRAEMYFRLRDRVKEGFFIDKKEYPEVIDQLKVTQYALDRKGRTILIPKEDIKKLLRDHNSPDFADALALSFQAEGSSEVDITAEAVAQKLEELYAD